jgi:hypothetical protein
MPRVGFEPLTPVFERAEAAHVLDRGASAIGSYVAIAEILLEIDHYTFLLSTFQFIVHSRFIFQR